jgi:hypothetical protein
MSPHEPIPTNSPPPPEPTQHPTHQQTPPIPHDPAHQQTPPIPHDPAHQQTPPIPHDPAHQQTPPLPHDPAYQQTPPVQHDLAYQQTPPLPHDLAYQPGVYGPQRPWPPTAPTGPMGALPRRRARSRAVWLLAAAAAVLLAGVVVISVLGFSHIGRLHDEASDLRAEKASAARSAAAAVEKQKTDLRDADLAGKLDDVHEADTAAENAFRRWDSGSIKFGVLDDAIDKCDDAVDTYNQAAAPFPDDLLGNMPKRIDITEPSTDCGRGFTARI